MLPHLPRGRSFEALINGIQEMASDYESIDTDVIYGHFLLYLTVSSIWLWLNWLKIKD